LIGIFLAGVSFGCFEVSVPALLAKTGLSVIKTNLLWSVGPLCWTITVPIVGWLIDKSGPIGFFVTGLFVYALCYPLFHLMVDTLWGLGIIIALIFVIDAVLELTVYPIIAVIVDSRKAAIILPFAYSLNEVCIQAGFAVGNLIGVPLDLWGGLKAIGSVIGGMDGVFGIISLFLWRHSLSSSNVHVQELIGASDVRETAAISNQEPAAEKIGYSVKQAEASN
jgi:MFS family permease